jgi:hypothetical protein
MKKSQYCRLVSLVRRLCSGIISKSSVNSSHKARQLTIKDLDSMIAIALDL